MDIVYSFATSRILAQMIGFSEERSPDPDGTFLLNELLRPEIGQDLARQKVGVTELAPLADQILGYQMEPWEMNVEEWEEQVDYVRDYFTRRADIMLDYLDQYLQLAEEGAA